MFEALALSLAQGPMVALASTTSDTRLLQDPVVHDEAWIRREDGAVGSRAFLTKHAQQTLVGDLTGNGSADPPAGVDALCVWNPGSGQAPLPHDFAFSMVSDLGAFSDGDLLRFSEGGGLEVLVAEAEFLALLQPASGSFDLDGVSRPPGVDEIWFSVTSDLVGTVVGDVADGDVLVWDRASGNLTVAFTEAEVQLQVDQAVGASNPVGDVLAMSHLPGSGLLGIVVQSPSSLDGSVVVLDPAGVAPPQLLAGWEEGDWAFQQSTEIDALAFVDGGVPQPPVLDLDLDRYQPGETARFKLRHGEPGSTVHGYRAVRTGFELQPGDGIGFLFLDRTDPWLRAQVRNGNTQPQVVDPSGSAVFDWLVPALPPGVSSLELCFQAHDDVAGWAAPIALRIG